MSFSTTSQRTRRLLLGCVAMLVWGSVATSGVDVAASGSAVQPEAGWFESASIAARFDRAGAERFLRGGRIRAPLVGSGGLAEADGGQSPMIFGVYPGGGIGETGSVQAPDAETILARLDELRGDAAFDIHLYTAWSWHAEEQLNADIERYTTAGYQVTLTIKYAPPPGREGDTGGYAGFVRGLVQRYAANPLVHQFVIGNEINVAEGNPGSSDGPYAGVRKAAIAGVLAAQSEIMAAGSDARVGFSMAVLGQDADRGFLQELAQQGGPDYIEAIDFLGVHVYPGLWPVGSGDPYADLTGYLAHARSGLSSAGFADATEIFVLENGFPTTDEGLQLEKLDAFVRSVCDSRAQAGISGYSWFDLWDADSASADVYAHYGLLRSDMSRKASFLRYQEIIAAGCATT